MSYSKSRISKWFRCNSSRIWYLMNNIRDARPRWERCGIISPRRCFSSHVQDFNFTKKIWLSFRKWRWWTNIWHQYLLLCATWACYGTRHCPSNVICWCGWIQSTRWINLSPSTLRQWRLFIGNTWLGSTNVCLCAIWHWALNSCTKFSCTMTWIWNYKIFIKKPQMLVLTSISNDQKNY